MTALLQESSLLWNQQKDPVWFKNQELQDRLNAALGTNLNSVPTMLFYTGRTAELALEHNWICTVLSRSKKKKACKPEVPAFVGALIPQSR